MKLDRHVIELMTLIEKATDLPSYTLIPQLIREEVVEIRWKPTFHTDERNGLTSISYNIEVDYNEKARA